MKHKKTTYIVYGLAILLFISGLIVFTYPKFTDFQYKKNVTNIKENFYQRLEVQTSNPSSIDVEDLYKELLQQNNKLFEEHQKDLKDPFSYEQPNVDLNKYGIMDNIIGFIKIPSINIELPIYLGANTKNMRLGAVHLTQTSYPIGGNNTNCVLAAHRGYSKTAMFRDIENIKLGDEIYIENFKEKLTYKVVETRIIKPTDIDQLLIQTNRDLVTLITCHPLGYNSQRYVVFCERIV